GASPEVKPFAAGKIPGEVLERVAEAQKPAVAAKELHGVANPENLWQVELTERLCRCQVPQQHAAVCSSTRQHLAVGADSERDDCVLVPGKRQPRLPAVQVPDLNVGVAVRQRFAVG